jgi:hypothetical protein
MSTTAFDHPHVQYQQIGMVGRVALLAAVMVSLGMADDARPRFISLHKVWAEREEMYLEARIVPHADNRTVAVEAWELEVEPQEPQENDILSEWVIPTIRKRLDRVRYSEEDAAPKQAVHRFKWRGLDRGDYELVIVVALKGGRTVTSTPSLIMVR